MYLYDVQSAETWTAQDEAYAAGEKRNARDAGIDDESTQETLRGVDKRGPNPQKKQKSDGPTIRRPKAPPQKPRGMTGQKNWDAATFFRDTVVPISVMQLAELSAKARAGMAEALRLEPAPHTKAAAKRNVVREEVSSAEIKTTASSMRIRTSGGKEKYGKLLYGSSDPTS